MVAVCRFIGAKFITAEASAIVGVFADFFDCGFGIADWRGGLGGQVLELLDFWIIGTPSRNTIPCSKNHFFCHMLLRQTSGKPDGFANRLFQKWSNSRLRFLSQKVPKFQKSTGASRTVRPEIPAGVLLRRVVQNEFSTFVVSRYFSWRFGVPFEEASDFFGWGNSSFVVASGAKCVHHDGTTATADQ